MADITELSSPTYGSDVINKLNEIIDWLNGTTDADRVTDITVSGNTLTVLYINGTSDSFTLPDTVYTVATVENNGLITSTSVFMISALEEEVNALNAACAAIEKANEAIDDANATIDYYQNGGGGGGSDNAGDGDGGGDGDGE